MTKRPGGRPIVIGHIERYGPHFSVEVVVE